MNTTRALLIAIPLFLIFMVFLLYKSWFPNTPSGLLPGTPTDATLPFSSNTPFNGGGGVTAATSTNAPVDITKARDVASSTQGFYFFSNPPVSSHEDIEAVATTTPHSYEIYYFPETKKYTVLLLAEPLADTRNAAAEDLAVHLGLSGDQLCALNYEVNVPYTVNDFYSAKNLGFPGCFGATALPGD